jgi:hypothetical protein
MSIQLCLVVLILAGAIGYAGWRIYQALQPSGDPCRGCELKKNCKKFGQSKDYS